jgi:hypothetical protein
MTSKSILTKHLNSGYIKVLKMEIITEDGKRFLKISDFSNWIVIFENNKNIDIDKCYDGLFFYKKIYNDVEIVINTSFLYKFAPPPSTIKLELSINKIETDLKEKVFLEKDKQYYLFVIPRAHIGPVYQFKYDGEKVFDIK